MSDNNRALVDLAEAVARTRHPGRPSKVSQEALKEKFAEFAEANPHIASIPAETRASAFENACHPADHSHHRFNEHSHRNAPYSYCQLAMTGTIIESGDYEGPPCCVHFESWKRAHHEAAAKSESAAHQSHA